MNRQDTLTLQKLLKRDGFDPGPIDGIWGRRTRAALYEAAGGGQEVAVPLDWMPPAQMARIVFHWTAGAHKANEIDRKHYHILIEGDGALVRGHHAISDNAFPIDKTNYAAHVANANTGSIGVSLCAMRHAKERPFDAGPYPITDAQLDALIAVMATLCQSYAIPVSRQTVLSHAEVQPTLGIAQSGKWDVAWIPGMAKTIDPIIIGDAIRDRVREALHGLA